jgi:hypothetical protein
MEAAAPVVRDRDRRVVLDRWITTQRLLGSFVALPSPGYSLSLNFSSTEK